MAAKKDDVYRLMPVWDLIDGLLDNRFPIYEACKHELLRRMGSADTMHIVELVQREAEFHRERAPKKKKKSN